MLFLFLIKPEIKRFLFLKKRESKRISRKQTNVRWENETQIFNFQNEFFTLVKRRIFVVTLLRRNSLNKQITSLDFYSTSESKSAWVT